MKIHVIFALIFGVFHQQVSSMSVLTAVGATQDEANKAIEDMKKNLNELPKFDDINNKVATAVNDLFTLLKDEVVKKNTEINGKINGAETVCYGEEDLNNTSVTYKKKLEAELDFTTEKKTFDDSYKKCEEIVGDLDNKITDCDKKTDDDEKVQCYQEIVDSQTEFDTSATTVSSTIESCDSKIDPTKSEILEEGQSDLTEKVTTIITCIDVEQKINPAIVAIEAQKQIADGLKIDFDLEKETAANEASKKITDELPNWAKVYEAHKDAVKDLDGMTTNCWETAETELSSLPSDITKELNEKLDSIIKPAVENVNAAKKLADDSVSEFNSLKTDLTECDHFDNDCVTRVKSEYDNLSGKVEEVETKVTKAKEDIDNIKIENEEETAIEETTAKGNGIAEGIESCILSEYYSLTEANYNEIGKPVKDANDQITDWKNTIGENEITNKNRDLVENINTKVKEYQEKLSKLKEEAKKKDTDLTNCEKRDSELENLSTTSAAKLKPNCITEFDKLEIDTKTITDCADKVNVINDCKLEENIDFECVTSVRTALEEVSQCSSGVTEKMEEANNTIAKAVEEVKTSIEENALNDAQEIFTQAESCLNDIINGGLMVVPSLLCLVAAASFQFMFNN